MKDLQPKINHLRERYKTNARKMNEEVMALYKKEGVNPFNPGCLPMFLQMPILFALFIVLRKAIELRGAHTMLLPWVSDLSRPESLISLTSVFPNGIPMYGNSIALLPIIMAILTFFQNKMTIKDPNQKMMIYFMPIFMLVLFNNFPAGLVLYWTFSNALGIVQQYMLEKSIKAKALTAPVQRSIEENRKKR
jgi:YidC/Oxa1 family membrane protein insertase